MADFEDWTAREPKKRPAACDEDALEADVFGAARDGPDEAADAAPAASGAAWHDDDDDVAVDLRSASRLRKLRKTTGDGVLDGGELESRLRERFAQQSGEAWAVDRKPDSELADAAAAMEADDGGELRVERVADANVKLPGKASIQCVSFHGKLDLLMAAGFDKTARFFHVDGRENALASQLHVGDLPVHCGGFLPVARDSSCVAVVAGRRPYFYRYDVQAEAATKIAGRPRSKDKSLERFAAAPDGELLAFTGHDGGVLLCDAKRGSWLPDELKMNGTARAVAFGPAGSHLLYSSGGDAEVYVWDLRKNRCVEKFGDAGASPTSALCCAPRPATRDHWLHVASESGVLNAYDRAGVVAPPAGFGGGAPAAPARAVLSLTTTVDTVVASEKIVAFSSKWAKDALRILHLPSLKVSPNWPTSKTPLHYVTALALNRDSSLLAIGNDRGKVLLYKLKNI